MATPQVLARVDKLIWVLAYGGLFVLILGIAVGRTDSTLGWILGVIGAVVALAGFVLIPVRARLDEDKPSA